MHTPQEVDQAFKQLEIQVLGSEKSTTSCEDVLQFLYENREKVWWMSWEFVGQRTQSGKYLSHRSPARISDLSLHEPALVEDRKIGRYKAYRLRTENLSIIEARLGKKKNAEPENKRHVEIKTVNGVLTAVESYV